MVGYLKQCLKNDKTVRWADSKMPLKVYIQKLIGDKETFYTMAFEAFRDWQNCIDYPLKFTFIDNAENAHIILTWAKPEKEYLTACKYNINDNNELEWMKVYVGLDDFFNSKRLYKYDIEVKSIILHVVGRSLGLLGTSPKKSDIMHALHHRKILSLSFNDIETMNTLYSYPPNTAYAEIIDQPPPSKTPTCPEKEAQIINQQDLLAMRGLFYANTSKIKKNIEKQDQNGQSP